VASGFTLAEVHGMTLHQVRTYGDAVEDRRKRARTELLTMLRAAQYSGKDGARAFQKLQKVSRTASWLIPG